MTIFPFKKCDKIKASVTKAKAGTGATTLTVPADIATHAIDATRSTAPVAMVPTASEPPVTATVVVLATAPAADATAITTVAAPAGHSAAETTAPAAKTETPPAAAELVEVLIHALRHFLGQLLLLVQAQFLFLRV
jgi:hypothetical protein